MIRTKLSENYQDVEFVKELIAFIDENIDNKINDCTSKIWMYFKCAESFEFSQKRGFLQVVERKC